MKLVLIVLGTSWAFFGTALAVGAFNESSLVTGLLFSLSAFAALPFLRPMFSFIPISGLQQLAAASILAITGFVALISSVVSRHDNQTGSSGNSGAAAIEAKEGSQSVEFTFRSNYQNMTKVAQPCNRAINFVEQVSKTFVYQAARDGEERCREAWSTIQHLSDDDEQTKYRSGYVNTYKICSAAYLRFAESMKSFMQIINRDGTTNEDAEAEELVSFTENMDQGIVGRKECAAQWVSTGYKAGLSARTIRMAIMVPH